VTRNMSNANYFLMKKSMKRDERGMLQLEILLPGGAASCGTGSWMLGDSPKRLGLQQSSWV